MSRVRLYVDEDAAHYVVVEGLRRANFDVLTASHAGMRGMPDEQHLKFATAQGRTLYSLNVADFARLHAETLRCGGAHAGIIIIPRQRFGPGEKLRRLLALLDAFSAEEMISQIRYI